MKRAFALGALLLGCGGAEPAPQTPAAAPPPAPAPEANPADACNELLVGLSGLTRAVRQSSKDVPGTSAGILPSTRRSIDAFVALRAQLKRAVDIDKTLTSDATTLDQVLAGEVAALDALAKEMETDAKALRDLSGDVEKLRQPFLTPRGGPCAKKDVAVVARLMHDAHAARLNPFETCATPEPDDWEHIQTMDRVRFKVRVGGDTKDLVVRREFGRFQLLRFDIAPAQSDKPAKPAKPPASKKKPQAAQR